MPQVILTEYGLFPCYIADVEPECSSGEIRLIGGASDSEGLVQLCINGTYTILCRDGWDTRDASVVCRQLGLPTGMCAWMVSVGVEDS